jgi:excisionase family DNA binding protein
MLTVAETAALLGISRMTVIRKADAGELPCLIVIAGPRKKTRRFPRRFVEDLVQAKGRSLSLAGLAAIWLRLSPDNDGCHREPE